MASLLVLKTLIITFAVFRYAHGASVPTADCKCPDDTLVPCTCDAVGPSICTTPCMMPPCKNPVQKDGECCPSCPADESDVKICITCPDLTCENQQKVNPEEVCMVNGETLKVGETSSADPCRPCTCQSAGKVTCVSMTCDIRPECDNPVKVAGNCCATCP